MKLTFLYNAVCAIRNVKYKFLLVLKLTTILLLVGALHLSAASYSQTVTLFGRNKSLETVFKEIKQQTGYLFFYNEKVSIKGKTTDIDVKNAPLQEALNACLKNNGLSFTIINKTIVIQNKTLEDDPVNHLNKVQISGQVIDSVSKAGIPGVNISLKGAVGLVGQTNNTGEFNVAAEPGQILVFSFMGYKAAEVKVTTAKVITVKMVPDINNIKDVVVTGYQIIKKDNYTGSAITVSGADLKRNNPQNLLKSIQSFDPSFKVLDNNLSGADPNKLPKINVRGATAIPSINDDILDRNNLSSNYNLPAFILDGFEVTLQKVVDLDINRIESVTLLKDGAATAVYGSRAANGVMVITTKAPVAGKLQLSYNYELTFNGADLSDYHVLNAKQKLDYERLVGLYDATSFTSGDKQDDLDAQLFTRLKNVASGVNTYWLSQPLRNAYQQKHSLYAQGGDQSFRYGIDLRYQTQPGIMKGSDNTRYSGGVNFTYNPNSRLIIRNDLTVTQVDQANSPYGNFSTYVNANPYFPMRDSSGALVQELANWRVNTGRNQDNQYVTETIFNPLYEASLSSFNKSAYTEILESFSADYKLSKSLRLRALMSVNKTSSSADKYVSPLSSVFYYTPSDELNNRGTYDYINSGILNLDGNVTLSYNKQLGDNYFNLVLGANILSAKSDTKTFSAEGFSNDRFSNIGFARIYKENVGPGGDVIKSRTAGSFFSGNYSYKNKYLLDVSFRVDGSSAFGADKRFAPFWSVGTGWNIHKEAFLEGVDFISQLRLKGSIATLGSISFPAYQSRSIYQYQTSNWYSTGIGATILGYGNSNLEWQKTKTYDAGLDIGLFKDRVVISPRYYYKLTKGLITDINLAPSTGFSTYKDNLGDMSNKGYELYLVANVFRATDWNVNITGNLAHNVNQIVHISESLKAFNNSIDNFQTNTDNNAFSTPLSRYVEGKSLNTIYAVKSLGIDPENGKEILVKKDGSLTYIWDIKDIQDVGNTTPKAEGFFGSSVSYKRFLLSFSFHYRFGGQAFNQTLIDRVENADPRYNVDSRVLEQRWKQPGDHTFFKNIADLTKTYVSSRFVQNDNLVELQSLYFSYDFNSKSIRKYGLQNLRLAATANDLFRASSIQVERGINYPFARSLTFSIQGSF
jgi:TonB-linked SusC/RagA family outer membrane protein